MTDMIEKMARAMCEADGFNWDDQLDPMRSANGDEDGQAYYLAHAKAALSALEEPSEVQIEAGFEALYKEVDRYDHPYKDDLKDAWSAMIKAAKGEEGWTCYKRLSACGSKLVMPPDQPALRRCK